MDRSYWRKQTADKPLYPDLLWSRPENKLHAGKLLIIGGSIQGFAAPAKAYAEAQQAGIGTARVILPDSLQKTVSKLFPAAEYAPSTPSGSFKRAALAELCELAAWSDGVLLAGDFGRNSETAILLEQFTSTYDAQLTIAQDSLDYFLQAPGVLFERPNTLLVPTFQQLQKLAVTIRFSRAFTSDMDFLHVIDALHELTERFSAGVALHHVATTFTAASGSVVTTKPPTGNEISLGTRAAVWWLQNPGKLLESASCSLVAD